jgi:hypothetical protein
LGALSDQLLKDIGLSRVDAEREAGRPFWDHTTGGDVTLRSRNRPRLDGKLGCCAQA